MARSRSRVVPTLIGIALLLAAGGTAASSFRFRATSLRTTGQITRLITGRGYSFPVFVFTDLHGQTHTIQSHIIGPIRIYREGQTVSVLYQSVDPYDAKIDDWVNLWMLPIAFGLFGILCL